MNPNRTDQGGAQNQERQPAERTGSFKPPKQPAGPYNRDNESGDSAPQPDQNGKVDEQGLPNDESRFG
jgi:hypothetical protein